MRLAQGRNIYHDPYKTGNFFTSWATVGLSRRILLCRVS